MVNNQLERDIAICKLFLEGQTICTLSNTYDLTRQRIQQILSNHGYSAKDGGLTVIRKERKKLINKANNQKKKIRERSLGMSLEKYNELLKCFPQPYYAFIHQRANVKRKKIKWALNFGEWWDFWEQSGQWEYHGRGQGFYVLTRIDFNKGFTKDNVCIDSFSNCLSNPTIKRNRKNGN